MQEGVDGLLRDKTRPPGKAPLSAETVRRVIDLALGPPPGETTHWTGRMLAKAAGVSLRSVQRILEANQLAPHRIRTFKLSNDVRFADKLRDIVGLYVDPPAHAVVLSVDEKSQIQALDRTQPGLPMKKGRAGTKRNGTTTLFAALNVLDGIVIGKNMQRHRHQEFVRFLSAVEAEVPSGKLTMPSSFLITQDPTGGPDGQARETDIHRGVQAGSGTAGGHQRPNDRSSGGRFGDRIIQSDAMEAAIPGSRSVGRPAPGYGQGAGTASQGE